MAFSIKDFLTNPDVLYTMAGLGAGMSAAGRNPFGAAAGQLTMQGIGAENQKKFLDRILDLGGEAKFDRDNATIKLPSSAFLTGSGENLMQGLGAQGVTAPTATPTSGGLQSTSNPYIGSPGSLAGLSLAGLSPDDVRQSMQLRVAMQEVQRKRMEDLMQQEYHREALETQKVLRQAQLAKALQERKTTNILDYEEAVRQGFKGTIEDWMAKWRPDETPVSLKEYERAKVDPEYRKFLEERQQWRIPPIPAQAARESAVTVEREIARMGDDLDKYRSSKEFQRKISSIISTLDKDPRYAGKSYESKEQFARSKAIHDYLYERHTGLGFKVEAVPGPPRSGIVIFRDVNTGREFRYAIK